MSQSNSNENVPSSETEIGQAKVVRKPRTRAKKVIEKVVEVEQTIEEVVSDTIHNTKFSFRPKSETGKKLKAFFTKTCPRVIKKNYKIIFSIVLVLVVSIFSYFKISELQFKVNDLFIEKSSIDANYGEIKEKLSSSSLVVVTKKTLDNDMATRFTTISPRVAKIIVDTVMEESKKYNINPMMLYSMGSVESSQRFWIEHDKVTITVPRDDKKGTKQITTRAVGWGGVIWEHHHKLLKEKGIAYSRADLFYPDVNIRAAAAIFDMFTKMPLKDGVKNKYISAQRRYFGGNYKEYSDRINLQVVALVNAELYKDKPARLK